MLDQADTMDAFVGLDTDATDIWGDEELTDLITAQRSYEASARVMTAIDEMLQVLISTGRVGR